MDVKLTKQFYFHTDGHIGKTIPAESLGEVIGMRDGYDSSGDAVLRFKAIFYGYPGVHEVSPDEVESLL